MALKLKKTINIIEHEYWVAEKHENLRKKGDKKTEIIMMLYTSKATRNAGQDPVLRERFQWDLEGSEKTGADVYAHVKLSRVEKKPVDGARMDQNGNIESVDVEANEFINAEDEI